MVQKGLKEVGYSYVNVDDGFFGWRCTMQFPILKTKIKA